MDTRTWLSFGNRTMGASGTTMLLGIAAAYPLAPHFGLATQIVAHLAIVVAAGFFKLGYVLRLAAQHEQANARVPQRQALATV